ncbi:MAG: TlpA disulfide reductase family protein [Panacibacter sp.]
MKYTLCFFLTALSILTNQFVSGQGKQPALVVGDAAPELVFEKWLKMGGFDHLEKGKVYVIDLWATWCTPCIAGMPHLSKLQEKYKDNGLEIIGITSEDKWGNTYEKVAEFVEKKDSIMQYNVAWVPKSMNKDSLTGIFVHPWMQKIGTMNLPTAIIIDRNGKIAFISDPHTIDQTLDEVINNRHDLAKLKKNYLRGLEALALVEQFTGLLKDNNFSKAIRIGNIILDSFSYVKPVVYLAIADAVPRIKGKINSNLLDIALKAGKRGVLLTQFESPGFLSALATVYAAREEYLLATIVEKAAVSVSEGQMKENQIKEMEKFRSMIK